MHGWVKYSFVLRMDFAHRSRSLSYQLNDIYGGTGWAALMGFGYKTVTTGNAADINIYCVILYMCYLLIY